MVVRLPRALFLALRGRNKRVAREDNALYPGMVGVEGAILPSKIENHLESEKARDGRRPGRTSLSVRRLHALCPSATLDKNFFLKFVLAEVEVSMAERSYIP